MVISRSTPIVAASYATEADLETLQKMQSEFASELATLKEQVESAETKVATLEKQQFSTTTKLSGQSILVFTVGGFTVGGFTGGQIIIH
jgi:uncharacterized protein YhaN